MDENANAVRYIIQLINKLRPDVKIKSSVINDDYQFYFQINKQRFNIIFDRDLIEDFEVALEKYVETSYYFTIENAVKFQVYIYLGQKGLISDFNISTEILNERRDWAEDVRLNVSFDKNICQIMNSGLIKLSQFLQDTIAKYKDLELPSYKEDKEYVDSLIEYYKKKSSFDSTGVSARSLAYLKAAILCEIIDMENRRREESLTRVRKEIDRKIYEVVSIMRKAPFLEISLPECVYEYASYYKSKVQKNNLPESAIERKEFESGRISTTEGKKAKEGLIKWKIKEEVFTPPFKPDLQKLYECFVIMPIGKENTEERRLNEEVYSKIIEPCIKNSGFNISCSHAGLIGTTGSIPRQIIEKLYQSDIVVADLRSLNPNVLWELGVRHAFLKRSIMICADIDEMKNFFDISIFRVFSYNINGESNQDFFKKICSCIQEIVANPTKPDNPVWDYRPVKYKTPSIFSTKATIDDNKTNWQAYYQGGNHMKINFSIMFDNESSEKNYIMEREFLLLSCKKELIGKLNIAGEISSVDTNKELGLVTKVFQRGMMLPEDSPVPYDFEVHIRLDNVKKKINIREKDELHLSCNFIPRNGSSFSAGTVKFPVIFSR